MRTRFICSHLPSKIAFPATSCVHHDRFALVSRHYERCVVPAVHLIQLPESMLGPCLPTPPVLLILAHCDMQHDWPTMLATPRRGNRRPTTNLHRTRKQGLFFGSRGSRVYALRASSPPRRTLSCRSAMDREIRGTPMICPMPTSGASYDAHSHFGHLHPTSLLLFPPSWLMTSRRPTDY
jgi:hypothetical protein